MEFFVLGILISILFLFCGYLIPFIKRSNRNAWKISFMLSAVLTIVTLFTLNQHRLVLGEQTQAIDWVKKLRTHETKKSVSIIRDNFIFIDNSFSNQLLPLPGGNQLGHSTIRVTDRMELARLLQVLHESDSLTDAIVCDIYMDIPSSSDSILREWLIDPVIESKLLLAENFLRPNTEKFASLNENMFGNIVEHKTNDFFVTYQPYRHRRPSISYKLYNKLKGLQTNTILNELLIWEKGNGWPKLGLNAYIPSFRFTDEKLLYDDSFEEKEGTASVSGHTYFELGDVIDFPGSQNLLRTLYQRKKENKRNIVFIGSFKGSGMDMHTTFYGDLHGPTIILNLFFSHMEGQHRISILYILYLWLGISCVLFVLIKKAVGMPVLSVTRKPARQVKRKPHPALAKLKGSFYAVYAIIIAEEIHFWLFVLFVFATAIVWDKIINGFALFILLHILYKTLQYYSHHKKTD